MACFLGGKEQQNDDSSPGEGGVPQQFRLCGTSPVPGKQGATAVWPGGQDVPALPMLFPLDAGYHISQAPRGTAAQLSQGTHSLMRWGCFSLGAGGYDCFGQLKHCFPWIWEPLQLRCQRCDCSRQPGQGFPGRQGATSAHILGNMTTLGGQGTISWRQGDKPAQALRGMAQQQTGKVNRAAHGNLATPGRVRAPQQFGMGLVGHEVEVVQWLQSLKDGEVLWLLTTRAEHDILAVVLFSRWCSTITP